MVADHGAEALAVAMAEASEAADLVEDRTEAASDMALGGLADRSLAVGFFHRFIMVEVALAV